MGPFVVVQAVWLFLPAYAANMAPVFAMNLFPRWNSPLDRGVVLRDRRRLFGAGKTWRGLVSGSLAGALVAASQSAVRFTDWDLSDFGYASTGGYVGPLALGFALGFGALMGDAGKSFFKRRTGREGGAPWVPFDQLDFVLGALLLAWLASGLLVATGVADAHWWKAELWGPRWPALAVILVLTPALHLLVNFLGYKLKLKKVPW